MSGIDSAWVNLTAPDGHRLRGFEARPRGVELGRLIVVQELLGVTGHIRRVCENYAAQGYLTLAPAFFDRVERDLELTYDAASIARGRAMMDRVPVEVALKDAQAALDHLGGAGSAAIAGYCWGGTVAWAAAAHLPVRAAIVYYGAIHARVEDKPRIPTQLHFGQHDHAIPVAVPEEARRRHPELITHIYPAGHGFNCDERDSFHPASAALARQRTLGLLQAVF